MNGHPSRSHTLNNSKGKFPYYYSQRVDVRLGGIGSLHVHLRRRVRNVLNTRIESLGFESLVTLQRVGFENPLWSGFEA